MDIQKVVIPVAGSGTRLLPATKSQPKEMLPVGRKPVVQYVVEEMVDHICRDDVPDVLRLAVLARARARATVELLAREEGEGEGEGEG